MFCFVFLIHIEAIDLMWRTSANTIEGRGHALHDNSFLIWLCKKGTEVERDVFFGEKNVKLQHRTGAGGLQRHDSPTQDSQPERRSILELKEHIMNKCYLTHGLDGRLLLAQTQSAQARP